MSFRHIIATTATLAVAAAGLAGCSSDNASEPASTESSNAVVELKVGASPVPHAKILKFINDELAADEGLAITVVEFQDYIQPNAALESNDIDANFFQTVPYLEEQSKKQGYEFDHGEGIHLEPLGVYSEKLSDISEIKDNATIGIINDPTNQARALRLLAKAGVVTIPEGEDLNVSQVEASEEYNPKKITFQQVEGPQLIRALGDVDAAVINGNFAQAGGKSPKDAIFVEETENNPALNILAWNTKGDKIEAVKKLDKLLHSDKVREFIEKEWADKSVLPAF